MTQGTGANGNVEDLPGGFRQTMAWLHTWAGLTLGWLLFFIFVTGTAGYFDTEIDRWMQPELPPAQTGLAANATAAVLLERLREEAPGAERWVLALPTGRNQPHAGIFWRGASIEAGASAARGSMKVDASSGDVLQARDTGGGQLLYQMHWRLHYFGRTYSDWIIASATLFMFIGLVTGVIVHRKIFRDFFTFRPGKGQRSWLDAHNVLSVVALPFHLMITYSGLLFMGFAFMPLIVAGSYGSGDDARRQFFAEVFQPPGLTEAAGESARLASLSGPIREAEERWGAGRIRRIDIRHPGDENARIIISETIEKTIATEAGRLVFDGINGKLLHGELLHEELLHDARSASSTPKGVRDAFLGLHEGLFAQPVLRWLYFVSGLLGTGMVATGLMMWTAKRRQNARRRSIAASRGLLLVEKLNVGTIIGLPIGIAVYFWANRLLPADMPGRAEWEAHSLFLVWAALLIHAALRSTQRAWFEQLILGGLAFGALPLLNAFTTDRHLGHSLPAQDWVFAGFDLTVLALGAAFGWAAWRIRQPQRVRDRSKRSAPAGFRTSGRETAMSLREQP